MNIDIQKIAQSRISEVDFDNLPFGKVFSDHMLVAECNDGVWSKPEIKPFGNLSLHPATSAIHYGQSIFEGMKAQKDADGNVLLFRPELNYKRFNDSTQRMSMPEVPEEIFMGGLKALLDVDRQWIPTKEGQSLYIRPFMFATDDYIGIRPSSSYLFMIFTCPVGAYYAQPLRVKVEQHYSRAVKGGVGKAKTAGNYAAALYPAAIEQANGYHQLVWTDAIEHKYIEESGTMNIVFKSGNTVFSPAEDTGTILPGTTKRSVLDLAAHWGYNVEERAITVEEIKEMAKNGALDEVFGAGTAATIAPITTIGIEGVDYDLPEVETREFSNKIKTYLTDLKTGKLNDELNWIDKF